MTAEAPATTQLLDATDLRRLISDVLGGHGVPADQAATVATLLVEADLRGVDSHGSHLLSLYVTRLKSGHLQPVTKISVEDDQGSTMLLDGGLGFGQVAGLAATELAAERGRQYGIAAVGVRESTHLGALGAYTKRLAESGLIAFCFQNGPTIVPPYGGVTPLFSTNPLSYAIPTGTEPTIVYDIATTAVAGNKVLLAKKRGDPSIPPGWANDTHGRPTTDTTAASVFHLQWFGGHKGFGLGLLVEVLAGLLTGSSFGTFEHSRSELAGGQRLAKGYLFLALDPARLMGLNVFRDRVDQMINEIRSSELAEGAGRIYLPGEPEHERGLQRQADGIPLPRSLVNELNDFAIEVGAEPLPA